MGRETNLRLGLGFHVLLNLVDSEDGAYLTRWIVDECFEELRHLHNAIGQEIGVLRGPIVVLVDDHVGAFVRIHT